MSPNLNWILNPNNFDLGFIRIELSVQIHSDSKSRIKSDIFSTDLHRKRLKTFVGLTRLSSDWLEFRVNRIGFGINFNPKLCQGWNLEMMSCRKLIKLKKTENFNLFEFFFFNCYFKNIVSSDVSDSSSGYECISFFIFFTDYSNSRNRGSGRETSPYSPAYIILGRSKYWPRPIFCNQNILALCYNKII